MKTTKNNAEKTVNTIESNLITVNANLSEKLKAINLQTIVKETQSNKELYKYPAHLQNLKSNETEKKSFRRKLRTQSENKIYLFIQAMQKNELTIDLINEFKVFYTENFNNNDYSLQSYTQKSEKNHENIEFLKCLDVVLNTCKEN